MAQFYLSPFAVNVFNVFIMLLFMITFLIRMRAKTPATRALIVFLSGVALVFGAFTVIFSTLNPTHATVAWVVLHLFVFPAVAMVQFGYHFPENSHPGESQRVMIICAAASALVYPWYLYRIRHLEPVYTFEGGFYVYLDTPEVGIVIGMQILWMLLLFVRKLRIWTAGAAGEVSVITQILHPTDRRVSAVRDLLVIFITPMVLVALIVLAYLGHASWRVVGQLLGSGLMVVIFAFIVAYINHASEPSTLMIKLIGISLGTVLIVLGWSANVSIGITDRDYDRERLAEITALEAHWAEVQTLSDSDIKRIAPDVRYIVDTSQRFSYNRDALGGFLAQTTTFGDRSFQRASTNDADGYYISYQLEHRGEHYQVGYSYRDYRRQIHESCQSFLVVILASTLLVVVTFPAFLTHCLVRPMNRLLHGVGRVNDGDLNVKVPVHVEDELGFLAKSFNRMVFSIETSQNQLRISLDRQVRLTESYSYFMPAEFLQFLDKASITEIRLGDHVQREMTLFFSDIRSFTTLSEKMSPQDNFDFINQYLGRIGPVVRNHHGFIDKYMGDGVMALFPHDADDAVDTAMDMRRTVTHFNQERLAIGEEVIRFGIGIHTGEIMLGTVGEEKRMDGTVISDAVNLAARLEGLTKIYGVVTIISRHTLDRLKHPDRFRFRLLDVVQVKGKQISVEIYEALAPGLCSDDDYKIALLDEFSEAMQLYRSRDFSAGTLAFSALLERNPQDSVARLYVGRCEALAQSGVPENWDGATVFEQK